MSTPPTILECFDQRLPLLTRSKHTYEKAKSSGQTTRDATPLKYLHPQSSEKFTDITEALLQSDRIRLSGLRDLRISNEFEELSLDKEAGVVCASLIYVILPILEVLRELYPGRWVVRSEHSTQVNSSLGDFSQDKKKKKQVMSAVEKPSSNRAATMRYDLIFQTSHKHETPGKTICILEYKKREQVRYTDFQDALATDNESLERIKRHLEVEKEHMSTMPQENGKVHIKQLVAYAAKENCRHAALFNWNHLLVLDFTELDPAQVGSAGETAELSWVNEDGGVSCMDSDGEPGGCINNDIIRKVLLGWMYHCFVEAGFDSVC